jgi:DNA-binding NarL/FixJ family response regulator
MIEIDGLRKRFDSLSIRQREVAGLLADGLTNSEIAERVGITVHTVKAHRAEVMRRMEVETFAALVACLQRLQGALAVDRKKPLRVLIVEDDAWYRSYLTECLNERNFMAVGVADGDGFGAEWAKQSADIVVLDIELGNNKESGLAIASRLTEGSGCGVVMVTSHGSQDDRIKGLSIGVDAYFSKPVNIEELALTIANLGRRLR